MQLHRLMRSGIRCALLAMVVTFGVASVSSTPAMAQNKDAAKDFWKKGTTQYDLGNFEKAVEFFRKAYEEWPDAAFLFNIAQSYRQLNDCKNALFFYKRYLLVAKNAPNRQAVQNTIDTLEAKCKKSEDIRDPAGPKENTDPPRETVTTPPPRETVTTPPKETVTTPPKETTTTTPPKEVAEVAEDEEDDEAYEDESIVAQAPGQPTMLVTSVGLGPSFLSLGSSDYSTPALFTLGLGAGYPIDLGMVVLDVGGALTLTPVPWTNDIAALEGSSTLAGLLANVGANYAIDEQLSVRGEAGLGTLLFAGLAEGNPFTYMSRPSDGGALAALHLRLAAGVSYLVAPQIAVSATPVLSYSPAHDGLDARIGGFTRFDFLLGAGYRM